MVAKLPKSVKIGPHKYKVLYPYKFPPGTSHVAEICPTTTEIRIADVGQSHTELVCNFWHEVLHGIDKLTGQCRFEQDNESEAWLESITQIFVSVMVDNGFLNKSKFKCLGDKNA